MAFPTGWNKKHKIKIDHTKVSGSANLSNFPVLFTEANFLSSAFDNSQGKEIYTNNLLNDANLIGYWRFEDNLSDSSGEGHNLTGTAPDYVSGLFGKCADFNGSDDQVYIEDASFDFSGTAPLTFSAWVYVDTMPSSGKRFVPIGMQEGTTEGTWDKGLIINADGSVSFYVVDGAPKHASSSAGVISAGKWFLLTGTYDGTNAKIYVNGVLLGTVAATGTYNFTTPRVVFSKDNVSDPTTVFYNGKIDDAAIFNRALTATEIMGLYTGGQDLRFSSDASGTTQLAHEVVNWDIVNDKAEVWVKIPTLSYTTDTELYVWYDNDTVTPQAKNDTYGSQNVWSAYKAVWHFEDSLTDSTANAHTLSANGTTNNTSGKISSGREFERDNLEYLYHANHADFNVGTGTFTMQMWWKPESDSVYNGLMCKVDTDTDGYQWVRNTDGKITLYLRDNASTNGDSVTYGTAINAGTWYMLCITRDGTNAYVYVNGNEAHTTDHAYNLDETGVPFTIGPYRSNDVVKYLLDGTIDEARFIKGAYLTTGWIATEYNNQSSPATFATPIVSFVPKVIFIS